ncbi:hypothetical protein AA101099_1807 [Neoasaia chiangmaiensis NBRC 101099]|nr:hypothetical protein [Neoasaia chiangmaiensis]GBR39765.1 hypothetical protein AA101099_1807 [Neoasaia chiangmaiensis NBRC 101099]GEN14730.1 hypothetical protein NCH01_11610 [Neoasaia chiangmaiensis]
MNDQQRDEAPTEQLSAQPSVGSYEWHIQDVGLPDGPPCARFERMFDEDWEPSHIASVLTYLGIESRSLSEEWDWERGESLSREDVAKVELPAWVADGGWTLASAFDTEDAEMILHFVRPLTAPQAPALDEATIRADERRKALEDAARVCDRLDDGKWSAGFVIVTSKCAAAIRQMKGSGV